MQKKNNKKRVVPPKTVPIVKQKRGESIYLYLKIFIILLLTAAVYSNSIKNDFITSWDDYPIVMDNPLIKSISAENIKTFFSTKTFVGANYHPVTVLSYAIDYHFFKLDPHKYHLMNLIFHLLNVLLVFILVYIITKRDSAAIIVSLFFGIHPMHVESVAWIAERKDVLYTLFFIISLIFYVMYIKKNKNYFYLFLSLIAFLPSLYSKPAAVCMPGVIILLDYYYSRKLNAKLIVEKIPYFILAFIFGVITMNAQKQFGAFNTLVAYNFVDRIFMACFSLIFYIYKMLAPLGLAAMHYYPFKNNGFLPFTYYLSALVIISILFGVYKFKNYRKLLAFGFLFYFVTIALVIQVVPVGNAIVAERYSYIPYIGLFFIVGQLYSNIEDKKLKLMKFVKFSFIGLLFIYTIFFSFSTWQRNKVWKDCVTLFVDGAKKYPLNSEAHSQVASAKMKIKDYEGVIEAATKAININKNCINALYNRGMSFYYLKKYNEAIQDYTDAIRIKPQYIEVYNNRGLARQYVNDIKGAIEDYSKAIELKPDYMEAYINRGALKSNTGDFQGSLEDYYKGLALNPNVPEIYNNIGFSLFSLKQMKEANSYYSKAIQLNPNFMMAYFNRGNVKFYTSEFRSAIDDYNEALKIDNTYSNSYVNLGLAKYRLNLKSEACNDWQKAINMGNSQGTMMYKTYCK
ncbi:MAG: tetratricopeptide repeat protein [Bacteroidales bacterium]|jgi:tetratricopeptide (TPR) repeat protein